jgi:hypothetical protein
LKSQAKKNKNEKLLCKPQKKRNEKESGKLRRKERYQKSFWGKKERRGCELDGFKKNKDKVPKTL